MDFSSKAVDLLICLIKSFSTVYLIICPGGFSCIQRVFRENLSCAKVLESHCQAELGRCWIQNMSGKKECCKKR